MAPDADLRTRWTPRGGVCRPRWRLRRVLSGVVLAGVLTAGLGGAGASPANGAQAGVGLNNLNDTQISAVRSLGAHWVRMFLSWRALAPTPAPIASSTLASYEQFFSRLPAGTKLIIDVVNSPRWETGSADEHTPPANPNDYATFVGTLARRWGARVSAYEIWNEEDASRSWTGAPEPAAYVRLLKATYPAIKSADPNATVVLGGLTGNDYPFLEGIYQAGGKGFFDAVGVHTDTACNVLSPYMFLRGLDNRMIPDSFLGYREVHATMLAHGDDKPIWMTEASWRTTGAVCSEGAWAGQKPEGVTEEQQATYLSQAYHCLTRDPYVQVALWFPLQDEGPIVSGLLRADGSQKPSFAAMRSYLRSGDQWTEPCGALTGPRIMVASPGKEQTYDGPLPIHVRATSSQGVWRIRLSVDGKLIRNYDGQGYPSTLSGTLLWQGAKHISMGRHTLTFLAYDKEHNLSRVSVTVFHGSRGSAGVSHGGPKVAALGKPKASARNGKAKRRHQHRRHQARSRGRHAQGTTSIHS
jgi:hypothetical protein